jgi:hypothetical protein
MPRELKLTRDHFVKKSVSVFDCLKKTQTAFKFEPGKDFTDGAKAKNVIQRAKVWGAENSLKILSSAESDGSIVLWSEELTEDDIKRRDAARERMSRARAAKDLGAVDHDV